jgi:hypothetical protein
MAQVVEHLPSKQKALSSNPKTNKKKKRIIIIKSSIYLKWRL